MTPFLYNIAELPFTIHATTQMEQRTLFDIVPICITSSQVSEHFSPPFFSSFYVCWFLVALGLNLASTCTLSLLSKQLPDRWNGHTNVAIQYSNYCGRVRGAILGGAGVQMGMKNYIAVQIGVVGIGALLHLSLRKQLKAKTG